MGRGRKQENKYQIQITQQRKHVNTIIKREIKNGT